MSPENFAGHKSLVLKAFVLLAGACCQGLLHVVHLMFLLICENEDTDVRGEVRFVALDGLCHLLWWERVAELTQP